MANKATIVIDDVVLDAEKLLGFLSKGIARAVVMEPAVAAAFALLLGAVGAAVSATESAAGASALNIALDSSAIASIKAVWPKIEAFANTMGIKF